MNDVTSAQVFMLMSKHHVNRMTIEVCMEFTFLSAQHFFVNLSLHGMYVSTLLRKFVIVVKQTIYLSIILKHTTTFFFFVFFVFFNVD